MRSKLGKTGLCWHTVPETGKAWWPSVRLAWQSGSRLDTLQPNTGEETLAKTQWLLHRNSSWTEFSCAPTVLHCPSGPGRGVSPNLSLRIELFSYCVPPAPLPFTVSPVLSLLLWFSGWAGPPEEPACPPIWVLAAQQSLPATPWIALCPVAQHIHRCWENREKGLFGVGVGVYEGWGVKDWMGGMHYSVYHKHSVVLDFVKKQSSLEASWRKE